MNFANLPAERGLEYLWRGSTNNNGHKLHSHSANVHRIPATDGEQRKVNFFVLIWPMPIIFGRIVNVASITAAMALNEFSDKLKSQIKNPQMSLQELDHLMSSFVKWASSLFCFLYCFISYMNIITCCRHAIAGDHKEAGFADSAYGMSKCGIWKATAILAEQIKSDPRRILLNSVGYNIPVLYIFSVVLAFSKPI